MKIQRPDWTKADHFYREYRLASYTFLNTNREVSSSRCTSIDIVTLPINISLTTRHKGLYVLIMEVELSSESTPPVNAHMSVRCLTYLTMEWCEEML